MSMRQTFSDRLFHTLNNGFLLFVLFLVAYPLIFVVSASFSDGEALLNGKVWLYPIKPTLDGYLMVFATREVWIGYRNSLFYAASTTVLSLMVTMFTAYVLSVPRFRGRKFLMTYMLITIFFNGGLIPTYLLIKAVGLVDNPLVMILPGLVSVWNIIITRTFFQSTGILPLREAAVIDGADDFNFFFRILFPLSGAIIAVNCLFVAVGSWNAFFNALIYLNNKDLWPLQLVLRNILVLDQPDVMIDTAETAERILRAQRRAELMKYSLIIVANLPVLIAYPFVQKHFVKGVMIGSIKG